MSHLDEKDDMIVTLLLRNPRLSDNQIARETKLPLKTVNRRRKALEESGKLRYLATFDHFGEEPQHKYAVEFFIITLRKGITKKQLAEKMPVLDQYGPLAAKHIRQSHLAEKDGLLQILVMVESRLPEDLVEIMNADFYPYLERHLGTGAVHSVVSYPIRSTIRMLHNYLPGINMENGKMKKDWPVFVR